MHYVLVGISHKTAPVSVRDRLILNEAQICEALVRLKDYTVIDEAVVVSSNHRTELYVATESPRHAELVLCEFLKEPFEASTSTSQYFYRAHDREAITHLFNVTAGLDSSGVDESQIADQVQRAYQVSLEQHATGPLLKSLFETALFVAGRVRRKAAEQANKLVDRERDVFYETLNFQIKKQSSCVDLGAASTVTRGDLHGREKSHQKIS